MDETGLASIQFGRTRAEIPLILIHDGGGTTFSYYCLGDLRRPVYGIANPRFRSGQAWDSIESMARCYTQMIMASVRDGPIILGGWSMGGLLSLEITRILSHDSKYDIIGLILIDSIFPTFSGMGSRDVDQMTFDDRTKPEIRELVKRSMRHAIRIIKEWTPPSVDSLRRPTLAHVGQPQKQGPVEPEQDSTKDEIEDKKPYIVLLRATEIFHVKSGEEKGDSTSASALVDSHRSQRSLGWNENRPRLVDEVIDVPGHHFSIFLRDNIHAATEQIRNACEKIEQKMGYIQQ